MTEMTLYLVSGNTGEYSDYTSWPVRAFDSLDAAQSLVDKLTTLEKEFLTREEGFGAQEDAVARYTRRDAHRAFMRESGDPHYFFQHGTYTGTFYEINQIPASLIHLHGVTP